MAAGCQLRMGDDKIWQDDQLRCFEQWVASIPLKPQFAALRYIVNLDRVWQTETESAMITAAIDEFDILDEGGDAASVRCPDLDAFLAMHDFAWR